jgi:hypothetical protein
MGDKKTHLIFGCFTIKNDFNLGSKRLILVEILGQEVGPHIGDSYGKTKLDILFF